MGCSTLSNPRICLTRSNSIQCNSNSEYASVTQQAKPCLKYIPLVKMCGITTPKDATAAAKAGANYIGMILWPKSKRSISFPVAREIAAAAREYGAEPVGVFVDEDAAAIAYACETTGIRYAQLHGDGARAALDGLSSLSKVIYVMHADKRGSIQTPKPSIHTNAEWTLVDGIQGGSGEPFDWNEFKTPEFSGECGWFLAGGLSPANVARAVSLLRPTGVDVSSGICDSSGIFKDKQLINSFIHNAHNWRDLS